VYATIAKLPTLSDADDQLNSTRHFFQELNRFGMTSTVDAGATGVDYPKDYNAVGTMAAWPKFPIRISNFLFAQKPGTEMESFKKWTAMNERGVNHADSRLHGFVLEGGGEILVLGCKRLRELHGPASRVEAPG
jgi:predicted amidohydrolase YtcJ